MKGIGTVVKIGVNAIARLKTIGSIEITADTYETTNYDGDGWREFEQGLKDGGEFTLGGVFNPGDTNGQAALYAAFKSGESTPFSVIFPAAMGADWSFTGILTSFSSTPNLEGEIEFESKVKISGEPVLGLSASSGLSALAATGTGATLSPVFANTTYSYAFAGITATSFTVTATAAGQTLRMYVDGTFSQNLVSGTPSAAISITAGTGKKVTIIANETGKAQKVYEVIATKAAA